MSNTERTNERFDLGEGIARQELNVIFVIDNSGSMQGEKIGAVNNAIRDVMSIMPEIQEDTSDAYRAAPSRRWRITIRSA